MSTCYTGTNLPLELEIEPCKGEYTLTNCIVNQTAIPYLSLPANSPLNTIINNLILSIQYKDELISQLATQLADLDTRVIELETP